MRRQMSRASDQQAHEQVLRYTAVEMQPAKPHDDVPHAR